MLDRSDSGSWMEAARLRRRDKREMVQSIKAPKSTKSNQKQAQASATGMWADVGKVLLTLIGLARLGQPAHLTATRLHSSFPALLSTPSTPSISRTSSGLWAW